ncbi:unnamed protein product [Closterium sp. NIES-65]|nr:unnamed protein product [Closterium sp. NIES-65]
MDDLVTQLAAYDRAMREYQVALADWLAQRRVLRRELVEKERREAREREGRRKGREQRWGWLVAWWHGMADTAARLASSRFHMLLSLLFLVSLLCLLFPPLPPPPPLLCPPSLPSLLPTPSHVLPLPNLRKTMLMDMLFGAVQRGGVVGVAKRVHFNEAMLEVHQRMHRYWREREEVKERKRERERARREGRVGVVGSGGVGLERGEMRWDEEEEEEEGEDAILDAVADEFLGKWGGEGTVEHQQVEEEEEGAVMQGAAAVQGATAAQGSAAAAAAAVQGAAVLCFDEVQVLDVFTAVALGRLLQRVLLRGVVLVATSNKAPWELNQDGLQQELFQAFVSTVKGSCHVLPLSYLPASSIRPAHIPSPLSPTPPARLSFLLSGQAAEGAVPGVRRAAARAVPGVCEHCAVKRFCLSPPHMRFFLPPPPRAPPSQDGLQRELFQAFVSTVKGSCHVLPLSSPTDYRCLHSAPPPPAHPFPVASLLWDRVCMLTSSHSLSHSLSSRSLNLLHPRILPILSTLPHPAQNLPGPPPAPSSTPTTTTVTPSLSSLSPSQPHLSSPPPPHSPPPSPPTPPHLPSSRTPTPSHQPAPTTPLVPAFPGYSYFWPLGPQSESLFEDRWHDAVGRELRLHGGRRGEGGKGTDAYVEGQGEDIPVMFGRSLRVPVSVHGIARFSFSELCANMLGPPDYLALALRYHTLFLSEIPILSRSVHDQARRFLTLTDELYNHRCLLVCSAATAPNKLFKGLPGRVGSGGVRGSGGGGEGGGGGGEGRVDEGEEEEKEEGGIVPRIDLESLQFESEVGGSRLRRDVLAEGGRSPLTSSFTLPVRQLSGREEEFAFHRAVSARHACNELSFESTQNLYSFHRAVSARHGTRFFLLPLSLSAHLVRCSPSGQLSGQKEEFAFHRAVRGGA